MNSFLKTTLILSILFSFSFGWSQTENAEEELSLDKSNLAGQFDFVSKKSSSWRDDKGQKYEVIKVQYLQALKAHSLDSIKAVKADLTKAISEIKNQEKEISTLKTSLNNTQDNLSSVTAEKDNINFLGLSLSKSGYNSLVFSIIAILLGLCGFFAFKFKNSNVLTKEAKVKLTEVEAEYDEHRKTALEREQKVRRQLQDEINKNRNK